MAEYIEREAAVTALLELRKTYRLVQEKCAVAECILQIRDEQPAADVVEVVRCKDCVYCEDKLFCVCPGQTYLSVTANHFCGHGVKMDGKGEGE